MWIFPLLATALLAADPEPPKGTLVIVGGGSLTDSIYRRMVELSGAEAAKVVVVPHASNYGVDPAETAMLWHHAGAAEVTILDPRDPDGSLGPIREADLIWIRGGDQGYMMRRLQGSKIPEAIRERFQQGALVAGTSAGAAVMSRVMIAGNQRAGDDGRRAAEIGEGLGLWPAVIVDQHFTNRQRFDRLKGAVLDHPDLLGVGIDERTAVVVRGDGRRFEVVGEADVVIIDARHPRPGDALPTDEAERDPTARTAVTTHILQAGMGFDLDEGIQPPATQDPDPSN